MYNSNTSAEHRKQTHYYNEFLCTRNGNECHITDQKDKKRPEKKTRKTLMPSHIILTYIKWTLPDFHKCWLVMAELRRMWGTRYKYQTVARQHFGLNENEFIYAECVLTVPFGRTTGRWAEAARQKWEKNGFLLHVNCVGCLTAHTHCNSLADHVPLTLHI